MKNKEIKNKIKNAALSEMPDLLQKIDLKSIEVEAEQPSKKIKTTINFKLAFSVFLLVIIGFLAFQMFNINDESYPLDSDIQVLAFQTVSAQSFLEYSKLEETDLSLSLAMNSSSGASETDPYLDIMMPMIKIAELAINNKNSITYQVFDSDLQAYQNKIRYSGQNLNDETIYYDIYYNFNNGVGTGKLIKDDLEYNFTKDLDGLKLYKNDDEYIEVIHKKNNGQDEFAYIFFKNQTIEYKSNIKLFLLNNYYQAEFNYEGNHGLRIEMMMRRYNLNTMDVDYEIDKYDKNMKGHFNVNSHHDELTGKMMYRFVFDDSSTAQEEIPKHPHHGPGHPSQDGLKKDNR